MGLYWPSHYIGNGIDLTKCREKVLQANWTPKLSFGPFQFNEELINRI